MKKVFENLAVVAFVIMTLPISATSALLWQDDNWRRKNLVYMIGLPLTFAYYIGILLLLDKFGL